ncbi:MAG: tetratricopeptide repeat protein [Candidatus Desulfofervidus auxilii]|nr:tetratricopeptide repeat protein [Candidatus Desulfofervidus auxilii]
MMSVSFGKAENLEEGIKAFRTGKYEEAKNKLELFLKKHPQSPKAILFLGRVYKKMGKFSEAEKIWQEAIRKYPKNSYYHLFFYELGILAYELKQPEKAIKLLLKALENCKDKQLSMEICFAIGNCYVDMNNYLAARNFYQEALNKGILPYEYLKKHPKTYLNVAEIFFIYGNYEKAVDAYLEIASLFPKSDFAPKAWLRAGDALIKMKKFKKGLEAYAKVIYLYPESEEVWLSKFRMADLATEKPGLKLPLTSYYEAYKHPYETYLELTKAPLPELSELAYFRLAQIFLRENQFAQAVKFLEKHQNKFHQLKEHVLDLMKKAIIGWIKKAYQDHQYLLVLEIYMKYQSYLDKVDKDFLEKIAEAYYELGFYEEALKIYQKISLNSESLLKLAKIYYALRCYPDAYHLLQSFLTKVAEFSKKCDATYLLAEVNLAQGKYKEAIPLYIEFLEQCTPSNPYALYIPIAKCYAEINAYQDAISFLETMFSFIEKKEFEKQFIREGHWLLANCYYQVGDYENALKHYYEVLSLENDEDFTLLVWYFIADCYLKTGQKEKAISTYQKLKEKDSFWQSLANYALDNINWNKKYQRYLKVFTFTGGNNDRES